MNNRGGKRAGAGRPVGSKNKRTAELARAAAESGITPIEVMLGAMRELWAHGTPEAKREAAEIAKDAAPYIHPRLASIDQTIKEDRPFAILVEECSSAEEWEASVRPPTGPRRQVIRQINIIRNQRLESRGTSSLGLAGDAPGLTSPR